MAFVVVVVVVVVVVCSRHSFNDVTQINFRFRVLVMCHLRMAVMHLPTKFCANSSLSNSELLTLSEIQDGSGRRLRFRKMFNSELDRAICAKFGGQMHHSHA